MKKNTTRQTAQQQSVASKSAGFLRKDGDQWVLEDGQGNVLARANSLSELPEI